MRDADAIEVTGDEVTDLILGAMRPSADPIKTAMTIRAALGGADLRIVRVGAGQRCPLCAMPARLVLDRRTYLANVAGGNVHWGTVTRLGEVTEVRLGEGQQPAEYRVGDRVRIAESPMMLMLTADYLEHVDRDRAPIEAEVVGAANGVLRLRLAGVGEEP